MTGLDKHYPGDRAWEAFAQATCPEWVSCGVQEELVATLAGDRALASAVHWRLQGSALDWLDKPIPALQGARPRDCLTTTQGILALRTLLMRMP
jgi:hypothetical protein